MPLVLRLPIRSIMLVVSYSSGAAPHGFPYTQVSLEQSHEWPSGDRAVQPVLAE